MDQIKQKRDYQTLATFPYAVSKFFSFSERAASKYGLSMMQYEALLTIRGFPGREQITIGEMAEWLQIRYRSAIDLVDQLELERLIIRKKRNDDEFRVFIRITKKGKRVLEKLASLNKQELQKLKWEIQQ
ncbi:MAG TPA: MarR family transcriptional regulator, partial [Acidobacteriota bacterium]